ncbi:KxYKxGKxW signal peptide domain-containing protein, partial [Limosilactobacillus fermentum]
MRRNKFGKGYEENNRTTHVKLYKSGKKWVQSLMSKIGLISFSAKDVEANLVEKDEEHQKKGRALIDATLITGAVLGGVSVLGNQNAMADTKSVDTTTTDALATTNEATLTSASTSTTTSTSEDSLASLSTSNSGSDSASTSTNSTSASQLSSTSVASAATSVSASTSTSTASLVSSLSLSESQQSASDSATQLTATNAAATNVISANQLAKFKTLFSRYGAVPFVATSWFPVNKIDNLNR